MSAPSILIAGIGNIFLGDDAFGVRLAQHLAGQSWPPEVQVADFGIRGFDLAFALLDNYGLAILLDAIARGGPPGRLYVIEPELAPAGAAELEPHSMDPVKVLRLVQSFGRPGGRILVVGCEPATLEPDEDGSLALSPAVEAALPEAARIVADLIKQFLFCV